MLHTTAKRSAGRDDHRWCNAQRIGHRHQVRFARGNEIDERCEHSGIGSTIAQIIRRQPGDGKEPRAEIGIGDDNGQHLQTRNNRVQRIVNTLVAQHVYDTLVARWVN